MHETFNEHFINFYLNSKKKFNPSINYPVFQLTEKLTKWKRSVWRVVSTSWIRFNKVNNLAIDKFPKPQTLIFCLTLEQVSLKDLLWQRNVYKWKSQERISIFNFQYWAELIWCSFHETVFVRLRSPKKLEWLILTKKTEDLCDKWLQNWETKTIFCFYFHI